jgi:hypothetical protein
MPTLIIFRCQTIMNCLAFLSQYGQLYVRRSWYQRHLPHVQALFRAEFTIVQDGIDGRKQLCDSLIQSQIFPPFRQVFGLRIINPIDAELPRSFCRGHQFDTRCYTGCTRNDCGFFPDCIELRLRLGGIQCLKTLKGSSQPLLH